MHLKRLRVSNFRNLAEQSIDFSPGISFICGKNGEGKTNLLEAIYVLSLSKSYRTSKQQELINWSAESAAVFGIVADAVNEMSLAVGIEKGKRELYVNESKVPTILEYLGRFSTIIFSPADLGLIKGGPLQRRRFLDKHISDLKPSLLRHFLSYNKALANKAALLREGNSDHKAMDSWNVILAQSAFVILKERKELLKKLELLVNETANRVGSVDGSIELELESNIPEETLEEGWKGLFEFLRKSLNKEEQRKKAILGPHRDEVLIRLGGIDSRAFASQGQTRSLVLSLKFALLRLLEEEREESPVLLLDDVDSELDKERREALFEAIFSKERQVIITGTDYSALRMHESRSVEFMTLSAGVIGS